MKVCVLYKKEKDFVRCLACNHKCAIPEGQTGICRMRKNISGKLYLLVYGKVVAKNPDPIEKKPLYHFLPGTKAYSIGTMGCNFKCDFCQNFDISQAETIYGEETTPKNIAEEAIKMDCKTIAYTYNEPTVFIEFAIDTAKLARKKGLKNILVTNGYQSEECLNFISKDIDAMNIDLKSFSGEFYARNCKAKLSDVLDIIRLAHKKKIWIEITTLLIPNENDSLSEIEKIARFISSIDKNIPWHISRFFPMHKMSWKEPTNLNILKKAYEIGIKYLNYVYLGNTPEESSTFCPKCNERLIRRVGYLVHSKMKKNRCFKCGTKIQGVFE
jgi:pyruvate formate lyase activating enzyme